MKNIFNHQNPFSVAMWDFSYLVRRGGKEAEYQNWDHILDECAQRGYQVIRIDGFPCWMDQNREVTFLPQNPQFMWGNHETIKVHPRNQVIDFIRRAKTRNIQIGLSSWFLDDASHQKFNLMTPERLAQIWINTLGALNDHGLLNSIAWVDLCNEFPVSCWAPGPYKTIFQRKSTKGLMRSMWTISGHWGDQEIKKFSEFMSRTIELVRAQFPALKYTFSFQEFGSKNLMDADLSALDFIEAHVWAAVDIGWSLKSGHYKAALNIFPNGVKQHAKTAMKLSEQDKSQCLWLLSQRMDYWVELAKRFKKPLVTTEGWISVFYEDISKGRPYKEWEWLKSLSAKAVELAIRKGWKGICTSNFCQPHFKGMWGDVKWHRQMTNLIGGKRRPLNEKNIHDVHAV